MAGTSNQSVPESWPSIDGDPNILMAIPSHYPIIIEIPHRNYPMVISHLYIHWIILKNSSRQHGEAPQTNLHPTAPLDA